MPDRLRISQRKKRSDEASCLCSLWTPFCKCFAPSEIYPHRQLSLLLKFLWPIKASHKNFVRRAAQPFCLILCLLKLLEQLLFAEVEPGVLVEHHLVLLAKLLASLHASLLILASTQVHHDAVKSTCKLLWGCTSRPAATPRKRCLWGCAARAARRVRAKFSEEHEEQRKMSTRPPG